MLELVKWIQELSKWITKNSTQAIVFVLICTNVGAAYGWKKASDAEKEMFHYYLRCTSELKDSRDQAMKDVQNFAQQNMREKDSIITVLNGKINMLNNIIDNNKKTLNKVKSSI